MASILRGTLPSGSLPDPNELAMKTAIQSISPYRVASPRFAPISDDVAMACWGELVRVGRPVASVSQ